MAKLVQMRGHPAITAETVSEGLQQLFHDPTHVLLDLNLPDGKGTTILSHIRTKKMTTRVAVISGTSDAQLLDEARCLLTNVIFSKPPDLDALVAWMRE